MKVHPLRGNTQRLDGGAMFGNAPRALWERWCPPDELNRIELACRAMLVDEGDRKVLFETGIGTFFEPRLRERYGVVEDRHVLLDSLAELGLGHEDIDVVVLSHLHFDHAGGLLSSYEEGKEPELLFPNAQYVVGLDHFERARDPHPRDRASFIEVLPDLLFESGRVELVAGERSGTLGDGYRFFHSDGHTPGMMHAIVRGAAHRMMFCADLAPGVPWVHLPITMGYDRWPERLIEEKKEIFEDLLLDRSWLFFTHDARTAMGRIHRDERGRFGVDELRGDADEPMDLDEPC